MALPLRAPAAALAAGLLVAAIGGAAAGTPTAAELRTEFREIGEALQGRRLFSLNLGAAVQNLNSNVHNWVKQQSEEMGLDSDITNAIGDKIGQIASNEVGHNLGVDKAVDALNQATGMVQDGVSISQKGVDSVGHLSGDLQEIKGKFEPIAPIFASTGGIFQLISSKENMGTLVGVVSNLLNTSSVLETISGALEGIGNIFNKLIDFFKKVLSKINGNEEARRLLGGRRLFDYMSLLDGLSFEHISETMGGFVTQVRAFSADFRDADTTLSPVLAALQGSLGGRRLEDAEFAASQAKFKKALGIIVPTWKKMEQSTIDMCPTTLSATTNAKSLLCRISDFVKNQGLEAQVPLIVKACPDPAVSSLPPGECPTKSYSAGIEDNILSGQGGDMIAYILAAIAGTGVVGLGGVATTKYCKKKKDSRLMDQESMSYSDSA